jgi:hypothetical protein
MLARTHHFPKGVYSDTQKSVTPKNDKQKNRFNLIFSVSGCFNLLFLGDTFLKSIFEKCHPLVESEEQGHLTSV